MLFQKCVAILRKKASISDLGGIFTEAQSAELNMLGLDISAMDLPTILYIIHVLQFLVQNKLRCL